MPVIDSLLVKLGFDVKTQGATKYEKSLVSVRKTILGVSAAAGALAVAIFQSSKSFANNAEMIALSADKAGVSTDAYQELAGAAKLAGINQDQFASSLQQFNTIIGQASLGTGAGIQAFARLGVSIRNARGELRPTENVLNDVADQLKQFDQPRQLVLAQQLGFGADSLQLLLKGSAGIKQLRTEVNKTGVVISAAGIKKGLEFVNTLNRLKLSIKGTTQQLQKALLPTTLKLLKAFDIWLKVNKKIISQRLEQAFKVISTVLKTLFDAFSALLSIAKVIAAPFGGLTKVLTVLLSVFIGLFVIKRLVGVFKLLTVGVKALRGAMAILALVTSPITLLVLSIIALAAGFILLIDDINTFEKGGDSVIGRMTKKFEGFRNVVETIQKIFKFFAGDAEKVAKATISSGSLTFQPQFLKALQPQSIPGIPSAITNASGATPNFLTPSSNASAPITNGSSSSTTVNATINVTDSPDSQKTANAIKERLNELARQTERNLRNPVRT